MIYGLWTDEPFLVYEMSAAALLFAGIGVVVTVETLTEVADDVEDAVDDVHRVARRSVCRLCGQETRRSIDAPRTPADPAQLVVGARARVPQWHMRLGLVADSHVAVGDGALESAAWHNPFRLEDSLDRLARAVEHPLLQGADALIVLGDLVHFGDAGSLHAVLDVLSGWPGPVLAVSGNHDVMDPAVRLGAEIAATGAAVWSPDCPSAPKAIVDLFESSAIGLQVVDVVAEWPTPEQPFAVTARTLVEGEVGGCGVTVTHFPLLHFQRRVESAGFLYAGNLDQLAVRPELDRGWAAHVVLSGHLHLRAVERSASEHGDVLQLACAALVEAPYEIAAVELHHNGSGVEVVYECASLHEVVEKRVPALDPPSGRLSCGLAVEAERGAADAVGRLIEAQRTFYDLRAPDFGNESVPDRRVMGAMPAELVAALVDEFAPTGEVLELASGTGTFTRELVRHARSVTALDGSEAMHERSRRAVDGGTVRYVHADIFEWRPDQLYDEVFFGFWLSHVPPPAFDGFWSLVRSCLRPGGRVAFVDEDDRGVVHDDVELVEGVPLARRTLRDGRQFDVVKVFWQPDELEARLRSLGWQAEVRRVGETFLYGRCGAPSER